MRERLARSVAGLEAAAMVVRVAAVAVRALAARWLKSGALPIQDDREAALAEQEQPLQRELEGALLELLAALRGVPAFAGLLDEGVLTGEELLLLALAAAPDLDAAIGRSYARLRRREGVEAADVGLLLDLLQPALAKRLSAREAFDEREPLRALALIELGAPAGPLPGRAVRATDEVLRAFADTLPLLPPIRPLADLVLPEPESGAPAIADLALGAFDSLAAPPTSTPDALSRSTRGPDALLVTGLEGTGRSALLAAIASARGRPALPVSLPAERSAAVEAFRGALRDARLGRALLVTELPEALQGPLPELAAALTLAPSPLLLAAAPGAGPPAWVRSARIVALGELDVVGRRRLLATTLRPLGVSDGDVALVAERYPVRPGQIAGAVLRLAATGALGRTGGPGIGDLLGAIRQEMRHGLGAIAQRVEPQGSWSDVVLPPEILKRLRQIAVRIRQARRVYDEWGFGLQPGVPRGVIALFSGPPGTGKTLCAGLIAAELGVEIYRIDLSQVVSKWVGETEKNLARVFDEARAARALLLFDEADALFGKRTDVKSSSDRYANMEVNYLLQRIETYEGIAILTTNLQQSVDEAFRRRLHFRIDFPFPDKEARHALWRKLIPPPASLAGPIDFESLARRYNFSGGNIRNAVLAAAFAAAEAGSSIDDGLLLEAAQLEMEELGRLVAR